MGHSLLEQLRRLRPRDLLGLLLFLLALPAAPFCRRRRPRLWLLCEDGEEARDNAFALFRYLRREEPEADAVYAIRPGARDAGKAAALGETVPYGSLDHWVLYLAAARNISTQKGGNPCPAVCYLLEVKLRLLRSRRVFLQHGVTKDDLPYLHWRESRMDLFACGALPEYRFVRERFGYPPGAVRLLGLCRWDGLLAPCRAGRRIAAVPTWRDYLAGPSGGGMEAFLGSRYLAAWLGLLRDPRLADFLRREGLELLFCPHRKMAPFLPAFTGLAEGVRLLPWEEADIPGLLRGSLLLLTDYSSVAMDAALLGREVVYYQFDEEEYRAGHLPRGYFDYRRDGFGPVCARREEVLLALEEAAGRGFRPEEGYRLRREGFFPFRDRENCARTAEAIRGMYRA